MEFGLEILVLLLGLGLGSIDAQGSGSGSESGSKVDDWKAQRLQLCCKHWTIGVKPKCQSLCRYEADSAELMCLAHDCYNDLQRWMHCAADTLNTDPNFNCCNAKKINPICEPFCRGSTPNATLLLSSAEYFQCLFGANDILKCHAENLPSFPQYANPFRPAPRFVDVQLPQDKLDALAQIASGCK